MIVPYALDQHFWARRIHELGLGGPPVPFKRLTADALFSSITAALDSDVTRRALEMGLLIKSKGDGIEAAVKWFKQAVERKVKIDSNHVTSSGFWFGISLFRRRDFVGLGMLSLFSLSFFGVYSYW